MKAKWKYANSWDTLTPKQLGKISLLLTKKLSSKKFDVKILAILINLRWWQLRKQIKLKRVLATCRLEDLKKHYAYIYEQCGRTKFIKIKKFHAPGDRLNNISIEEFAVAENLFKLFWQSFNPTYLRYLTAVLYVPTPYPNRPEFNKNNLDNLAKPFKRLRKRKLFAIAFCYMGCKNHLAKKYKNTFPNNTQNASTGKDHGFNPVIVQMSGGKFGTHTETKTTNLYTFLDEYEENLKQIKDARYSNTGH